MLPILQNFLHADKMMYPVTPGWALHTFVLLLDSMIADYRNSKYEDERTMKKIREKLNPSSKQK